MDNIWTVDKMPLLSIHFRYICTMKHLFGFAAIAIVVAVLAGVTASGCYRRERIGRSGWRTTGIAQADLCVDSLERFYGHNEGSSDERWVAPLESIAALYPENDLLRARVAYWRVRRMLRECRRTDAEATLTRALADIDSASAPDDYARLKLLRWRFDRDMMHRYVEGQQLLGYFRSIGDSVSVATALMNLGDIMLSVHDYKRGVEYCTEASRIWREVGQEEYADKNMLNVALMSEPQVADSIHRSLLANEKYRRDTTFYCLLLRNHYLNTDSVAYLIEARGLTRNSRRLRGLNAVHDLLYSDWLASHPGLALPEMADSIAGGGSLREDPLQLALNAAPYVNKTVERRFEMLLNHALGLSYRNAGEADSAAACLLRYANLKDSVDYQELEVEKANADARDRISAFDHEQRLAAERAYRTTWIVALGVAIVLIVIAFLFYKRATDRENKARLARRELREARARLSREALMTQEHQQLLRSLEREIAAGESAGEMSGQLSAKLRSTMKTHNAARDERQAFLEVHDNMLPGFQDRLKGEFPQLSEKQLRLAAYICAGMSSSAIARVLNISTASVMKSRYRLRGRLGLAPSATLEEFLRRYVR